jgi:nitrile hydratase subunit beta
MFVAGETVRVRDDWPETRGPVHIRTPYYVRGVTGQVVRHLGDFRNPEDLAFGGGPASCRATMHDLPEPIF